LDGDGGPAEEADELFARWLESRDAGRPLSFEELAGGRADLVSALEELGRFWEQLERAGGVEAAVAGASKGAPSHAAPGAEAPEPATTRYRVRGELGRGGMGVVFEVDDEHLRRRVAMKVVRSAPGATGDRRLTRFLDEAQVTAQLEHPGIVPVHELGRDDDGRAYFTMALVEGETLTRVVERLHAKDPDWSLARALDVVAKVGDAVAYAHSRGVVHRDLKPDNVMVGRFGQVYVMDWGLARVASKRNDEAERAPTDTLATDQPFLTHDGDVVGTPAFMPPEQAFGRVDEQGPRCDVYALGAILYHVLCGRAPYADRSEGPLAALRHGGPTPLLALDPRLPRELVAVSELAMRRDPARRYPDVAAFTIDLRAYLEGRVVGAYESGALAQARKWVLRHRALTVLAVVLAVALSWVGAARLARLRVERLAERFIVLEELDDLERDAAALWPAVPERLLEFEGYIARGERLAALLPELRTEVADLPRARSSAHDDDARRAENWIADKQRQALERLERFAVDEAGALARVRERRARAAAIARVRAVRAVEPGDLLPLPRDPVHGLALFEHLPSAALERLLDLAEPAFTATSERSAAQGIVLVALPGDGGLLVGRDEVTCSQWARLCDDRRSGLLPVTDVSWIEAVENLARNGLSLPDHAEWQRAASGGRDGSFGFSVPDGAGPEALRDAFLAHEVLSVAGAELTGPAPVGTRRPNAYGLHDVLGNVSELLLDPFYARDVPREQWASERGLTRTSTAGFFRMRPELERDRALLEPQVGVEVSETEDSPYLGLRVVVRRGA
jgi:predicted Ser/Thr protein kinase